jgi:hypothetical protein
MDQDQINDLVKQLSSTLTKQLQEQQQEQMNKMHEQLDKMKEISSNKSDDATSGAKQGENNEDKTPKSYKRASYDYSQGSQCKGPLGQMPVVNPGKPPPFDGARYNDWAHRMKMHLIAARCWEVVEVGVQMPEEGEEITLEVQHDIMQNDMAVTLVLQCLTPDDNNKVQGMENAKRIWDTLKVSFEGDKSVRRGQIELLTSKIENFGWIEGDTTQVMFDKLMTLINNIRALGV